MVSRLDYHSTGAAERYVELLNNFRMFVVSAMRRDPTDSGVKTVMKRTAIDKAKRFKDSEMEIFDFALEDIVREAREQLAQDVDAVSGMSELSTPASDYMDDLSAFYETELTSQLQRDISQASMRLNDFALEVYMQRHNEVGNREALVRALIDSSEQVRFYFKDRSGRRHASQKFIRTMFRHTMLLAALHVYAMEASEYGASHMMVIHPENKAGVTGTKVGFRRDQGLPLIADLKDEIFHPNSRAFVKAVF